MAKIREIEEFVKYQKHLNKSPSTIISYKMIYAPSMEFMIKVLYQGIKQKEYLENKY